MNDKKFNEECFIHEIVDQAHGDIIHGGKIPAQERAKVEHETIYNRIKMYPDISEYDLGDEEIDRLAKKAHAEYIKRGKDFSGWLT